MAHDVFLAGDPFTIMAIVSIVAGLATILTQKKPKLAKGDDAVESNATRGAYVPLVIGRHRVGPIFAWVKDLTDGPASLTGNDEPAFGKGGPSIGGTTTYREEALHLLAVGPGSRLIAIYENGEKIWQQEDFTPANVASGTATVIPGKGTFKIYWGFPDDPLMTAPSGIDYRFPQIFKILWQPKELGNSRNWGRLEYEIECPCYSQIGTTPSEVPVLARYSETYDDLDGIPTQYRGTGPHVPWADTDPAEFFIAGFDGVDTILLYDNTQRLLATDTTGLGTFVFTLTQNELKQSAFRAGSILALQTPNNANTLGIAGYGSSLASLLPNNNTFYEFRVVQTSSVTAVWTVTSAPAPYDNNTFNLIAVKLARVIEPLRYISESFPDTVPARTNVTGALNMGTLLPTLTQVFYPTQRIGIATLYEPDIDSIGMNPIHILDQLLFARHPYGCGKDRSKFSLQSIENCAFEINEERIRGNIRVKDGEGLESVIAGIMQDLGLFIPWDPNRGSYVFRLIRFVDPDDVPEVPESMILSEPELQNSAAEKKADVIAFTFEDRSRNYRQEPISLTDTGQVARQESVKAKQVPIEVCTDYNSASRVALRRQQEVIGDLVALKWDMNHIANCAVPGDVFRAPSVEDPSVTFRVSSVTPDINSTKAEIATIVDSYTQPVPTEDDYEPELAVQGRQAAASYSDQEALEDFVAFEMPRELSGSQIGVLHLAVRSSSRTSGGIVWLSRDGSSYQRAGYAVMAVRATLVNPLGSDRVEEAGPLSIANMSLDFSSRVQDLTLDVASWRAGKQIAIIGDEICYLKNGEDLGGGSGELTGLIRGRLGTAVVPHDEDTPVYILLAQSVEALFSSAFVPGTDVSVKIQAYERSRAYDLSLITAQELSVVGKAYTPHDVTALRMAGYRVDYDTADEITILWSYHSEEFPRTGLGQQTFGQVSGLSAPQGYFLIELFDDSDTLIATIKSEEAQLVLSAADRVDYGDLDSLPYWTIQVTQVEGSFSSNPVSLQLQVT